MAHNISTKINQNGDFFSANGIKAWHGLGTVIDGAVNAEQALKLGGLDFHVQKMPIFTQIGEQKVEIADKYATVRTDTNDVLGVVGSRYEVIQNVNAFSIFDGIFEQKQAAFETGGTLGNGERVWLMAKLPDTIRIEGKDDITNMHLLFTNGHDGKNTLQVVLTPIRVVCNNTLSAALNEKKVGEYITIRHSAMAYDKMKLAAETLGLVKKQVQITNQLFNQMAKVKISDKDMKTFLEMLQNGDSTRAKNIREEIENFYHTGIGQNDIVGTVWGAYNAVTGYVDHKRMNKAEPNKRFESNAFGSGYDFKVKAMELLMAKV
jgi:phage/plasmid-like protein (TIGR03299 family)